MSTPIIRKLKWFWLWQDREQEEWLREMSSQGWHLKSVTRWLFKFEKGSPKDFHYCLDFLKKARVGFFSTADDEIQDYLRLLEDAGWERIGQRRGWQYVRRPSNLAGPGRIYTETESKIDQYRRILWFITLASPVFLVVFLANLDAYPLWFQVLLLSVLAIGVSYAGINCLMILRRIRDLHRT